MLEHGMRIVRNKRLYNMHNNMPREVKLIPDSGISKILFTSF